MTLKQAEKNYNDRNEKSNLTYLFDALNIDVPLQYNYCQSEAQYIIPMTSAKHNSFIRYKEEPIDNTESIEGYTIINVQSDTHKYIDETFVGSDKGLYHITIGDKNSDVLNVVSNWTSALAMSKIVPSNQAVMYYTGSLLSLDLPESLSGIRKVNLILDFDEEEGATATQSKEWSKLYSAIIDVYIVQLKPYMECETVSPYTLLKYNEKATLLSTIAGTPKASIDNHARWNSSPQYLVTKGNGVQKLVDGKLEPTLIQQPITVTGVDPSGIRILRTMNFEGDIIEIPITPVLMGLTDFKSENDGQSKQIANLLAIGIFNGQNLNEMQNYIQAFSLNKPYVRRVPNAGLSFRDIYFTSRMQSINGVKKVA